MRRYVIFDCTIDPDLLTPTERRLLAAIRTCRKTDLITVHVCRESVVIELNEPHRFSVETRFAMPSLAELLSSAA